ncbi:MAG: proteasome regulatory particle base subunit [Bathelium mastoideum]|nr:MAG: proteasome regulatory particle base subunit [Bathelium mastoideum]
MVGLTSAAGLVGFLAEPDPQVQTYALTRLNEDIDTLWTEIAPAISQIEALFEDESFPQRELAALVAAKVYYQLGEYNESMTFALGAGKLFELEQSGEFEDTIVAKCIDTYIALSSLFNPPKPASSVGRDASQLATSFPTGTNGDKSNTAAGLSSPTTPFSQSSLPSKSLLSRQESRTFDPSLPGGGNAGVPGAHPSPLALNRNTQKALQAVINRLFEACYKAGAYRQVVGIAVEARNLSVLREAILRSSEDSKVASKKASAGTRDKSEDLMDYLLDICMNVVQERGLRNEILQLILELLNEIPSPDYFAIARCVVYLNEYSMASNMLRHLVDQGNANARAIAYQLSFDLYDNGTQEFLSKVMDELPEAEEDKEEKPQMNGSAHHDRPEPSASDPLLAEVENRQNGTTSLPVSRTKHRPISDEERKVYHSIRHILRGTKSIELNLEFLYRNNKADRNILNKIRDSLEARNSIFHVATTVAQAFSNAGTTNDSFFRDNLEWLGKAVNWSKFTATAALGVLHKGNISQGQKLLEPYLPKEHPVASSIYSQGGALYALGLIYSNHGTHVLSYLRDQFKRASDEVIQHGGALGLGVAAMATCNEELFEDLKIVLYSDSAVSGEAIGLAMGLIMLGSGNEKAVNDLLS